MQRMMEAPPKLRTQHVRLAAREGWHCKTSEFAVIRFIFLRPVKSLLNI
jgi:hypothetical protein